MWGIRSVRTSQFHAVSFSTKMMYLETSPDLRLTFLQTFSSKGQWHTCIHRRLQWRDRWGITPHSVFPDPAFTSIADRQQELNRNFQITPLRVNSSSCRRNIVRDKECVSGILLLTQKPTDSNWSESRISLKEDSTSSVPGSICCPYMRHSVFLKDCVLVLAHHICSQNGKRIRICRFGFQYLIHHSLACS